MGKSFQTGNHFRKAPRPCVEFQTAGKRCPVVGGHNPVFLHVGHETGAKMAADESRPTENENFPFTQR